MMNINNDFNLAFQKAWCFGHLQCCNDKCKYFFFNNYNNEMAWTNDIVLHFNKQTASPSVPFCQICSTPPFLC